MKRISCSVIRFPVELLALVLAGCAADPSGACLIYRQSEVRGSHQDTAETLIGLAEQDAQMNVPCPVR